MKPTALLIIIIILALLTQAPAHAQEPDPPPPVSTPTIITDTANITTYQIDLPSGAVGGVTMLMTAGDVATVAGLGIVATLILYQVLSGLVLSIGIRRTDDD